VAERGLTLAAKDKHKLTWMNVDRNIANEAGGQGQTEAAVGTTEKEMGEVKQFQSRSDSFRFVLPS
jgi:hypothetical protein